MSGAQFLVTLAGLAQFEFVFRAKPWISNSTIISVKLRISSLDFVYACLDLNYRTCVKVTSI